jgi:hypothetical protein
MIATGFLQRQEGVIHLLVDRMHDLSSALSQIPTATREFR